MSSNIFQQVFQLSMASNAIIGQKGSIEHLQKLMEVELAKKLADHRISGWKPVWGPTVRRAVWWSRGPDNTWFVVQNPAVTFEDGKQYNTYVVAIAGTATVYDWVVEDLHVNQVVDVAKWVKEGVQTKPEYASLPLDPSAAYVAAGTVDATHALITLCAPKSVAGAGSTLYDYLSKIPQPAPGALPLRIVFTGHSLGGALAPTVAFALKQGGGIPAFGAAFSALAYPTAGPSPGNSGFTAAFRKEFSPVDSSWELVSLPDPSVNPTYKVWNGNVAIKLDAVSQAWCTRADVEPKQNMERIISLYGLVDNKPIRAVKNIIDNLIKRANRSGLVYTPVATQLLDSPIPVTDAPKDKSTFWKECKRQHTKAYSELFGVNVPQELAELPTPLSLEEWQEIVRAIPELEPLRAFVDVEEEDTAKDEVESASQKDSAEKAKEEATG